MSFCSVLDLNIYDESTLV